VIKHVVYTCICCFYYMSLNIPLMHWKAQPPVKDSSENEEEVGESGRDVKENKSGRKK